MPKFGANAFPFVLASFFGVTSGVFIFKPMIIEYRIKQLQRQGLDVGKTGEENKWEEQVLVATRAERERLKKEGSWKGWWPF